MAETRVTDEARQASREFRNIMNNAMPQAIQQLRARASVLTNPQQWAGPHADTFRGQIWPVVDKDLDKLSNSLLELQAKIDKILADIARAGGEI